MHKVQLVLEVQFKQYYPQGWHCMDPDVEFAKYWDAQVVHWVPEEQVAQLLAHGRVAAL